jgi:hypothetical protein
MRRAYATGLSTAASALPTQAMALSGFLLFTGYEPFVEALRSDSASFCVRRRPRSAVGILRVAIRRVIAGCKNTSCVAAIYLRARAPLEVNAAASYKASRLPHFAMQFVGPFAFYRRRQLESSFIRRRRKNGIIKFKAGPLSTAYPLFYSRAP